MPFMNSIKQALILDPEKEVSRISSRLIEILRGLKRKGIIVGISGGIDSSVTLALAVKALGKERVLALQMPEHHSAEETLQLSGLIADTYGVERIHEDISKILEAVGFYRRYDETVRTVIPEYSSEWKSKIVSPSVADNPGYTVFSIVAQSPAGKTIKKRLPLQAYLEIVASTNFKQRIRKMLEYYHADRRNFAVTVGLAYNGTVKVRHIVEVLFNDVGPAGLAAKVVRPLTGLKVSLLYGLPAGEPVLRFRRFRVSGLAGPDRQKPGRRAGQFPLESPLLRKLAGYI